MSPSWRGAATRVRAAQSGLRGLARRLIGLLRIPVGGDPACPEGGSSAQGRPAPAAPPCPYRWWRQPVCVLVPVFNAAAEVRRCMDALLAHTPASVEILVIDDASTEPAVAGCLTAAARAPNVTLARNETNLGFTRTVNRGLGLAGDRDVVILNSDTEVTPRWLAYLAAAAYERDDIGTATATSNSASQFSVPLRFHNTVPYWLDLGSYARAVAQCHRHISLPTPFGHGFCLYLKRRYLDAVGGLDSEAFPRGYGEEVDLCLRGTRSGWRHVLATKAFVYHVNAASFGASKTERKARARKVLDRRYPEYGTLLRLLSRDPGMTDFRRRVAALWQGAAAVRPRRLVAIPGDPADDPGAVGGLCPPSAGEVFLLAARDRELRLYRLGGGGPELVDRGRMAAAPGPFAPYGEGYEDQVGRWLLEYAIESIEIRGLRGHGAGLARLAADLAIPTRLYLEDAYPVCPTGALRDERGNPCGGRCTATEGDCLARADPQGRRLKHQYIHAWQAAYRRAIGDMGSLSAGSPGLRDQLREAYPELADREIAVTGKPGRAAANDERRTATPAGRKRRVARIGLLWPAAGGLRDRAFHLRLLAPLTHPALRERLAMELVAIDHATDVSRDLDLVLVPFAQVVAGDSTGGLSERLAGADTPLIVDLGCSPPGALQPAPGSPAADVLAQAAELWTDTWGPREGFTAYAPKCVATPTCVDERLWPGAGHRRKSSGERPLRLLHLSFGGDGTDPLDFALDVARRLRRRMSRRIELTVVDCGGTTRGRRGLRLLKAPETATSYPIFAAWLTQQGPFDFGLLPPGTAVWPPAATVEYTALRAIPVSVAGTPPLGPGGDLGPALLLPPSARAWCDELERLARSGADAAGEPLRRLERFLQERSGSVAASIVEERLAARL